MAPYIYNLHLHISANIYTYLHVSRATHFYNISTYLSGRWRGSVYKLVYKELLAYISLYLVINLTYR